MFKPDKHDNLEGEALRPPFQRRSAGMSRPVRIQRKRTKGWKMPANTVYVGRPTRWGNPWRVGDNRYDPTSNDFVKCKNTADCVQAFRQCVDKDLNAPALLRTEDGYLEVSGGYSDEIHVHRPSIKKYLRGKNLACWCPLDRPCHADVLLELANKEQP